jgi:hypothetical protein
LTPRIAPHRHVAIGRFSAQYIVSILEGAVDGDTGIEFIYDLGSLMV